MSEEKEVGDLFVLSIPAILFIIIYALTKNEGEKNE
jgi:hypothetical protein